jgi:hypothetical protein
MGRRLYAPDGAVKQMDVNGHRYEQRNFDGPFIVESARDARALKAAGCFEGALNPIPRRTTGGCVACGHRVFRVPETRRICAKCGTEQ